MDKDYGVVATNVLHLMKRSLKRMYILLIIFIVLLIISVIDSIYQRCRIIDLLEQFEVVEKVVTETYDVVQDGEDNNNNFITGDNNEVNNGTKD